MKQCIKCSIQKPFQEFHKDSRRVDNLFPYCKQCRRGTVNQKVNAPYSQILEKYKISESGCWEWTGTKMTQEDYGIAHYKGKRIRAHRLSYTYHIGDIPEGLIICHKCDNPICINPSHLYAGTHQDNANDKKRRGRCQKIEGENMYSAKLTEKDVLSIWADPRRHKIIAEKYQVSASTVSSIKCNRTWSHVVKDQLN